MTLPLLGLAGEVLPFALLSVCFHPCLGLSGGPWVKSEGSLRKGTAFVRAMLTREWTQARRDQARSNMHGNGAWFSAHKML